MQKRNKTKKAIKVQDLKPKKDAKGGFEPNIVHNPGGHNPGGHNPGQHGPHGK